MTSPSGGRGVFHSALLAVTVVLPIMVVYAAPFAILGFAIRELFERRWLTGAVLAACAGLVYVLFQAAGGRFVRWAEGRRQWEQP